VFTNVPDNPSGDRNYLKTLSSIIAQLAPNAALSQCSFVPSKLIPVSKKSTNPALNINELQNKRAVAFCGIANPHRFFNQLRKLGLRIAVEQSYPDHYWYGQADVQEIKRQLDYSGSNLIVTTAKDAVRLQTLNGMSQKLAGLPLWYLDIDVKYDSYH
jgi:tetraacyldisaccharide 4'-kinase